MATAVDDTHRTGAEHGVDDVALEHGLTDESLGLLAHDLGRAQLLSLLALARLGHQYEPAGGSVIVICALPPVEVTWRR